MPFVIVLLVIIVLLLGGWWIFATIFGVGLGVLMPVIGGIVWLLGKTWPFLLGGVAILGLVGAVGDLRQRQRQELEDLLRNPPKSAQKNAAPSRPLDTKEQAFREWSSGGGR